MKRRSFLKSFMGFMALPFVPKAKAESIITDSKPTEPKGVKVRQYTIPPLGWKIWQGSRILNESNNSLLEIKTS